MLEPTSQPPVFTPPPPRPPAEGHLQLLEHVRSLQRRALWAQGVLLGSAASLGLFVLGALVAASAPRPGTWLVLLSVPAGVAVLLAYGVYLARQRVGDDARTARLLAERMPELDLDLLAAVELSRALGERHDFSPGLAREFLRQVGDRARRADPRAALDTHDVVRAWAGLLAVLLFALGAGALARDRVARGLRAALGPAGPDAQVARREPITGDIELTYRYPAYTGLSPRVVQGTSGEVTAPAGTEVQLKTKADRDVDAAALEVNGTRVPLQRQGRRDLQGSFVVGKTGAYHFVFLDGSKVVARGPDAAITVEADTPPEVKLLAPVDEVELDPDERAVRLKYDVSDDYGLTGLELVYRVGGEGEQRVALSHDTGRSSRGEHAWDVAGLRLGPGQRVSYYLEAKDNDAPAGFKKGVSRTQTLKVYSAAEHRRQALEKAEALWERLVAHLADRMEGPDRQGQYAPEELLAGRPVDERGDLLAQDLLGASAELAKERDAPAELVAGLANVGGELRRAVRLTRDARTLIERMAARGSKAPDLGPRLATYAGREVESTERNVLYLESLLDLQRMQALKDLAQELRTRRRELSSLLEEYRKNPDEKNREQLLQEMQALRNNIEALMQKMAELSKGIRDEHLNAEALKELQEQQDMSSMLDDLERLVREGKTDEAMKRMQELAMRMDEMLDQLDDASDEAQEEANPELVKKFQEFQEGVDEAVKEQERLAEQSRAVMEKYREQTRKKVAERGKALRDELLKKAAELRKSWESTPKEPMGLRTEEAREAALRDLEGLEQALKAQDFDLAREAAESTADKARAMNELAEQQRRYDELFQNPPEVRRGSKESAEHTRRDLRKAEEIREKLQSLFPSPDEMLSEPDRRRLDEAGRDQAKLERKADQLQRQMDELGQLAPIFDDEARKQMEQAGQRMGQATERLGQRDARGAGHEQGAALEHLQGLQRQMQQAQSQRGKGRGLPLPMGMGSRGSKGGLRQDKVEIPDEDPNRAPRELRKDVMDAMKQGAPDRYKEQVKKYYEELVK